MKFYVINKPHGNHAAEANDLKTLAKEIDENPFMIVAAESVKDGEDYQAIQIKPDTVQINFKGGHHFVTASSIAEAYQTEDDDDGDDTKITVAFVSEYGDIPNSIIFTEEGGVIDELPTMTYEDDEFNYEFKGWKLGKNMVRLPLTVKRDMKLVASWTKTEKFVSETYNFTSYATDKTTQYAVGTAKTLEPAKDGKQKIQVVTNEPEDPSNPFIGKTLFVNVAADEDGFHQLFDEDKHEIAVLVKLN